jgi:hypothetical protein
MNPHTLKHAVFGLVLVCSMEGACAHAAAAAFAAPAAHLLTQPAGAGLTLRDAVVTRRGAVGGGSGDPRDAVARLAALQAGAAAALTACLAARDQEVTLEKALMHGHGTAAHAAAAAHQAAVTCAATGSALAHALASGHDLSAAMQGSPSLRRMLLNWSATWRLNAPPAPPRARRSSRSANQAALPLKRREMCNGSNHGSLPRPRTWPSSPLRSSKSTPPLT